MLVKISSDQSDEALLQAALKNMSTDPDSRPDQPEVRDGEEEPVRAAPTDPNEAELSREEVRLATFERNGSAWPANAKMEPRKIAKAGLFYTGQYQETKCPWCCRVVTTWEYGDQAIVKHRSLSPDCPFVLNTSNNVPLLRMTPSPTPSPALSRSTSTPRDIPDGPAPPAPEPQQNLAPRVNIVPREFLSEANRFRTFEGRWPLDFIRPADLANAGFIYTGRDDVVQCVFCREFIGGWTSEDFPHTEHRSIFPTCPFVLGQECGNIPIQTQPYDPFVSQDAMPYRPGQGPSGAGSAGVDEAGCKDDDPANPDDDGDQKEPVINVIKPGGEMGIVEHTGPAQPRYNTVESRVRTFGSWPPDLRQRPTDMAEAGFYHIVSRGGASATTPVPDKVKCYYCDGGLMNWQPEDDPWTEHARWFNLCGFLRLVKGDEFIREVLLRHPRQPVPELPGAEIMPEAVELSVKEDQLRNMMSSMLVNQVLEMGVAYAPVEAALEKKLRMSGCGYKSAGELFDAAIKERLSASSNAKPAPVTPAATVSSPPSDETPSTSGQQSRIQEKMTETEFVAPPQRSEAEKAEQPKSAEAENMDIEEPKNPKQLEDEMQRLRDQRLCKVCFVNESNVAFLPCGHLICCVNCVPSLKDCPYCRQPITGTLKTYMS